MFVMALASLIRTAVFGICAVVLAPGVGAANQLNIQSPTPVRPQIYLGPSLHMDARTRALNDIDLSEACRPDERLRKSKRERRCRQER